jgi:Bacterial Ig-like domain
VIGLSRSFVLLLIAGALSATVGCAPPSIAASAHRPADAGGPEDAAPRLTMKPRADDATRMVVEATGLDPSVLREIQKSENGPERWRSFLIVRVIRQGTGEAENTPAMLGTYRLVGDVVRFEPRFPMEPGVRYRAEFDPTGRRTTSRTPLTAELSMARPASPPTAVVTAIYPTRAVLPENLLRFYIHFSAPMSRGEAYGHIRLLDASGRPIDDPFLELDEELWSGDGRRFTLLFDPGRIKRGLKPREEVGPVLVAGHSYELVVDPGWLDAAGNPLKSGFRKAFRTGPPDETSPDPKTWSVRPPAPETRVPLEVRFPEPLDRALLDRLIAVRDGSDRPVPGSVSVSEEETLWRFTPEAPWKPGTYRFVIGTELEDIAGNSIARPFEVDEVTPISRRIASETTALPFQIGPASR